MFEIYNLITYTRTQTKYFDEIAKLDICSSSDALSNCFFQIYVQLLIRIHSAQFNSTWKVIYCILKPIYVRTELNFYSYIDRNARILLHYFKVCKVKRISIHVTFYKFNSQNKTNKKQRDRENRMLLTDWFFV